MASISFAFNMRKKLEDSSRELLMGRVELMVNIARGRTHKKVTPYRSFITFAPHAVASSIAIDINSEPAWSTH
jgi:hypothetical protein